MKQGQLNITFHNPNAADVLIRELVILAAEVAKEKVSSVLLHMGETSTITEQK